MSASEKEFVKIERCGAVSWLILNEPERLNPTTLARVGRIQEAAEEIAADAATKVVVVTGAGRAFSAGGDLKGLIAFPPMTLPAAGSMSMAPDGSWTLTSIPQPVIALVNGPAIGYGLELALQADLRIATESAMFRAPFALLGTISDTAAATWLLPRIVGVGRAAEMLLAGRTCSAAEAHEWGLVNAVVPDSEAREFTQNFADELAQGSGWALRETKRMLYASLEQSRDEHILMQYKSRSRQPSLADSDSEYLRRFQQRQK